MYDKVFFWTFEITCHVVIMKSILSSRGKQEIWMNRNPQYKAIFSHINVSKCEKAATFPVTTLLIIVIAFSRGKRAFNINVFINSFQCEGFQMNFKVIWCLRYEIRLLLWLICFDVNDLKQCFNTATIWKQVVFYQFILRCFSVLSS